MKNIWCTSILNIIHLLFQRDIHFSRYLVMLNHIHVKEFKLKFQIGIFKKTDHITFLYFQYISLLVLHAYLPLPQNSIALYGVGYLLILKNRFKVIHIFHTLKLRPGAGGLIPEMIQVCDYDILLALVELNTPI